MSKITTPNEIIGKLDEMINAEESEIRKLEEIVNKTNSNKSNLSKSADIISDNEINLQIIKPRGSRKQVIKPGFTYASFLELVQATLGKDQEMIGFRNESQLGVVYIRSNQDVRLMEKYYFESGQENLQVVAIEKEKKEFFGISCLTNEKQYYIENYPEIVVESGSLDQVILMLTGGER